MDEFRDKIFETRTPRKTLANGRDFFPTPALRDIFKPEQVKRILEHECDDCKSLLRSIEPTAHPGPSFPTRISRTDEALNLFALLVYIKYPLLIGTFLVSYETNNLPDPRYFTQYDLNNRYFKALPNTQREQLIREFQDRKWQFSVPKLRFDDFSFLRFEEGTILPFLDEEMIEKGGFGQVYRLRIESGYGVSHISHVSLRYSGWTLTHIQIDHASPTAPGPRRYARKEIIDSSIIDFVKEKTNLERIATLKDLHLVEILKTYQLGDRFNIIFRCAKTNLYHYLRESGWHAPRSGRISRNPLWEQVLGITRALEKIINFKDPQDRNTVFFGYHLDLKPQNILVYSVSGGSDVFKITDFGQTEFVNARIVGTSGIRAPGGTDAYMPPEYLEQEAHRTYDIWSLGIIILEVLAFAIRGSDGLSNKLSGLDHVRRTKEGSGEDLRFYTGRGPNARLKPNIRKWIEELKSDQNIHSPGDADFVSNLLELIGNMLQPQRLDRISINDVHAKMQKLFKMSSSETSEYSANVLRGPGEVILIDR